MSTVVTERDEGRSEGSSTDPSADGSQEELEERGSLAIDDHVVERIAGHAVTLVPGAVAAPRRVLGVNVGESRRGDAAKVDATVHGDLATVTATIAVEWPWSVRLVCDDVRAKIRAEVADISGVHVDNIDIDVVSMTVPARPTRRVR